MIDIKRLTHLGEALCLLNWLLNEQDRVKQVRILRVIDRMEIRKYGRPLDDRYYYNYIKKSDDWELK